MQACAHSGQGGAEILKHRVHQRQVLYCGGRGVGVGETAIHGLYMGCAWARAAAGPEQAEHLALDGNELIVNYLEVHL